MDSIDSKTEAAFVTSVEQICRAAGGVRLDDPCFVVWQLETAAGTLHVSPQVHGQAPWIACRFLEPERAATVVEEVNVYTGKWNFRLWQTWSRTAHPVWHPASSTGLCYFQERLAALLNPAPTAYRATVR